MMLQPAMLGTQKVLRGLWSMVVDNPWQVMCAGLAVFAFVQTSRLDDAKTAIAGMAHEQVVASLNSQLGARDATIKELRNYDSKNKKDVVPTGRVVERIRNVCLQTSAGVPVPPFAPGAGPTGSEAEDSGSREADEQFVQDLQEDLQTCQAELNRLDAVRNFHNAGVKP